MTNAGEIAATLTPRQRLALKILAEANRPLRNKDFHEIVEASGPSTSHWAEALGACTKARNHNKASLWARGLVRVVEPRSYVLNVDHRELHAIA